MRFLCVFLATVATVALQPLAAQPPVNDVSITITWRGAEPKGVVFDDHARGDLKFERATNPDRYVGHRSTTGSWAFHDVVLSYDSGDFPIALRTFSGSPGVTLEIDAPTRVLCNQAERLRLDAVPDTSPRTTRLRTMMRARQALQDTGCATFGRRPFARIYFRMNCALARDFEFFAVSSEARTYLIRTAITPAEASDEIRRCEAQVRSREISTLADARLAARQLRNFRQASALSDELVALSAEADWQDGFDALHMDAENLRLIRVADLSDLLGVESAVGNDQQAQEVEGQLIRLRGDPLYASAFRENGARLAWTSQSSPAPAQPAPRGGVQRQSAREYQSRSYYRGNADPLIIGAGGFVDDLYRGPGSASERRLTGGDRIYRGRDGRFYCRRADGSYGLVVGAAANALATESVGADRSGLVGALLRSDAATPSVPADLRCR